MCEFRSTNTIYKTNIKIYYHIKINGKVKLLKSQETYAIQILLTKPTRAVIWYLFSYKYLKTVKGFETFDLHRNNIPYFLSWIGNTRSTMIHCSCEGYPKFTIISNIIKVLRHCTKKISCNHWV